MRVSDRVGLKVDGRSVKDVKQAFTDAKMCRFTGYCIKPSLRGGAFSWP
jgi:hypothetical protein